MKQEVKTYRKIINNIIYLRIDIIQSKNNKVVKLERTYSPGIKFGLENDNWELIKH